MLRNVAILVLAGFFISVLYLFKQLFFSSDISKFFHLPFTAGQNHLDYSTPETLNVSLPCNISQTPVFYPAKSSTVYLAFTPADRAADTEVRRIAGHDAISNECLEQWFQTGSWIGPCSSLRLVEPRVDLVWTWVNGSDPLHRAAREAYATSPIHLREKPYRQHDELRYSIRSATSATTAWKESKLHLVANSYPLSSARGGKNYRKGNETVEKYDRRLGQVPQWLDFRKLFDESGPKLVVHYDDNIFKLLPSSPNAVVSDSEIANWRGASLPTFNSFAIESQLGNLPPSEVSENSVFLMDDIYLLRPLSTSSFYSPIHGPILHLQPDLLVQPTWPILRSGRGEWRGLQMAASLLSGRFGSRARPYIVHNARAIPLPLLHEASLAFPSALASTATNRFRGQNDEDPEVHTLWLATQFIIERHREALLWSWVVGKWGGRKGTISREEKAKMWAELGGGNGEVKKKVFWPKRESRLLAREQLVSAGLPDAGPTEYAFVSSDGYPYTYLPISKHDSKRYGTNKWPDFAQSSLADQEVVICNIVQRDCFNDTADFEPAVDMFKRILLDKYSCGDCIISALISSSGSTGLSAFLPLQDSSPSSPDISRTQHYLPLVLDSILSFPYPSDPRVFSLRLLQRYSYVLGATPNFFFGARNAGGLRERLKKVDADNSTVLLCINDDIDSAASMSGLVDGVLKTWMDGRWPDELGIEKVEGENEENMRLESMNNAAAPCTTNTNKG